MKIHFLKIKQKVQSSSDHNGLVIKDCISANLLSSPHGLFTCMQPKPAAAWLVNTSPTTNRLQMETTTLTKILATDSALICRYLLIEICVKATPSWKWYRHLGQVGFLCTDAECFFSTFQHQYWSINMTERTKDAASLALVDGDTAHHHAHSS